MLEHTDTLENPGAKEPEASSDSPAKAAIAQNKQANTSNASRVWAAIEMGLIIVGLLYMFLLLPRLIFSDGYVRYVNIIDLLNRHSLTSAGSVIPGRDPGVLTRYSLIGPIFAIPLLYIDQKLGKPGTFTEMYNFWVFAIGLSVIYLLLRNRMNRSILRKFILLLIVASMFAGNVTSFYGETFTAVLVGFGVLIAFVRFSAPVGWVAVVLGVANTPAALIGLGLMTLKKILDSKRLRYMLLLVASGALILGEAWIRRGSPFANAYADNFGVHTVMPYSGLPGFSYPFFFGILSILFSFGKGLIFFAPGLILPVRQTLLKMQTKEKLKIYQVYTLWICFLIGLILSYSTWWAWYGGMFWGPRFFLFASIPASFALAVRLKYKDVSLFTNILTLGVLCLSVWVGINGAIMQDSSVHISTCLANDYALEAFCHYVPEFSTLWYPFVVHPHLTPAQKLYLAYSLIVFVFLAAPLLLKVVQQSTELLIKYGKGYLNLNIWRI